MKNQNYKIYIHTFPNHKVYIGITGCENVNTRWKNGNGYIRQPYMYSAIQKYGWGNIKHEIIFENLSIIEAGQKEIELIKKYKSNNKMFGYNISVGGEIGSYGYVWSEEQKENLRNTKNLWMYNINSVICLETLKAYASANEATYITGFEYIESCCKSKKDFAIKKLKTKTKITHWMYLKDYRKLFNSSDFT